MSVRTFIGDHNATTYSGSGIGLVNVPRTGIVSSTPNAIIVNDGAGVLSEELLLQPIRGGLGIDTSTATGIPRVTAGVWSVGSIDFTDLGGAAPNQAIVSDGSGNLTSEAQLAPSRGGTGLNTSSSTGVAKISAGTWSASTIVNSDISSSANIARNKLALSTPNTVVVNDITGALSSQPQLSVALGGLGADFSGVGAGPFLLSNSGGVISSGLTYSVASTPNSIVQRDGAGNINLTNVVASSVSTNTLTATGDLTVNPVGDIILQSDVVYEAGGGIGGEFKTIVYSVVTMGAVTGDLLTFPTLSGFNGTSYNLTGSITGGAPMTDTLLFSFFARCENIAGVVNVVAPAMIAQSTSVALNTASISVISAAPNIIVRVNGVAGKNINWCGKFEITSIEF